MNREPGPRIHEKARLDAAATRRLIAAYLSDDRPSLTTLGRRFGKSTVTLTAILKENGIEVVVTRGFRTAAPCNAERLRSGHG